MKKLPSAQLAPAIPPCPAAEARRDRSSRVSSRPIDFQQRRDLVIISAGKRVLRSHDLDVVGSQPRIGRGLGLPLPVRALVHHPQH